MTTGALTGEFSQDRNAAGAASTVRESPTPPVEPLEDVVGRDQPMIYGFLFSRLSDHSELDDLCQEVFLRFHQNRGPAVDAKSTSKWLIGIARNVLREHVRKVQRRREVSWTELCLTLDEIKTSHDYEVFGLADLPDCLQSLGPSAREALEMHYRDRLKYSEIAKRLSRSEGAVKLLLFRARQALRHCIQKKLHEDD